MPSSSRLSAICITSISAERRAGVIHNGHNCLTSLTPFRPGEARTIPAGGCEAGRTPEWSWSGRRERWTAPTEPGRCRRETVQNLSQSGIRRTLRPFHHRSSAPSALFVKKNAPAAAHGGALQLLSGERWSPTPRSATRAIYNLLLNGGCRSTTTRNLRRTRLKPENERTSKRLYQRPRSTFSSCVFVTK